MSKKRRNSAAQMIAANRARRYLKWRLEQLGQSWPLPPTNGDIARAAQIHFDPDGEAPQGKASIRQYIIRLTARIYEMSSQADKREYLMQRAATKRPSPAPRRVLPAAPATQPQKALLSAPEILPTRYEDGVDVKEDAFLGTRAWRVLRYRALKLHGGRCQCCGSSPSTGIRLNVDHIKPRKTHPTLALDIDNLQVLCDDCNAGKGNWDSTDWRWKEA